MPAEGHDVNTSSEALGTFAGTLAGTAPWIGGRRNRQALGLAARLIDRTVKKSVA